MNMNEGMLSSRLICAVYCAMRGTANHSGAVTFIT